MKPVWLFVGTVFVAIILVVGWKKTQGASIFTLEPGKPIDSRPPEKTDDKPAFPGQTRAPYQKSVDYKVTTLTDKLISPWSMAFLPDGNILITEKSGDLRLFDAKTRSLSSPLGGVPAVVGDDQGGLLDVALDPKFATNHRIFFSFTEAASDGESTVVMARAILEEAARTLSEVSVIFRAKPAVARKRSINEGGRIAIDPNGDLFMTVGDRSQSPPWDMPQRLDAHLGKVIHVTPDGEPAANNPYLRKRGVLPEIWAIGVRSEEGLAFDSATGRLWETEHGPRGGDELNVIEAGKNYGWPVIVHGIDYTNKPIGDGITEKDGMEQPRYYWDPVIAPSGLTIYHGDLFPQWKGSIFVGALRRRMVDHLTMQGDKVVSEEPLLLDLEQRIRDVREGPDGALYVLTDTNSLLKITPK